MIQSVSIIIPAYNEEENIKSAIDSVIKAVSGATSDYEIIVVDDGSADRTGELVEKRAKQNKRIKLLVNSKNKGFGHAFKKGISAATKSYITGFPGDNDMSWKSLSQLIRQAKDADLVFSYMKNPQARSLFRRILSRVYIMLMNLLFGLNLRYYNGHLICKKNMLKKQTLKSDGIAVLSEIKVLLIKSGATYKEIPFEHSGRKHGSSKVLNLKSLTRTVSGIFSLLRRVYIK